MGRSRKVVSMQKGCMTKAMKAARQDGESRIKANTDALSPPPWLSDKAALIFDYIVREAAPIGALDNLDLPFIAMFADNYARYAEAATYMNIHGLTTKAKNGYESPSVWNSIMNQAAANLFKCSTKLGLAATDRLKLITPVKEEKSVNKFVQFLDNGAVAGDTK